MDLVAGREPLWPDGRYETALDNRSPCTMHTAPPKKTLAEAPRILDVRQEPDGTLIFTAI